jgi:outer membrane murein-binding lipoprotein Lpp
MENHMRKYALAATVVSVAALAGCQSTQLADFFGTSDPCEQVRLAHVAYLAAADNPSKAEAVAFRAAMAQCGDGNLSKLTLSKVLEAYLEVKGNLK